MPSDGSLNPESEDFSHTPQTPQYRPTFWVGQHDSSRDALTDGHYDHILNTGVSKHLVVNYTLEIQAINRAPPPSSLVLPRRPSPTNTFTSG